MPDLSNSLHVEPSRQSPSAHSSVARPLELDVVGSGRAGAESPFNFQIAPNIAMGRASMAAMLSALAVPVAGLAMMAAALGYWPVSLFVGFWFAVLVFATIHCRQSLRRCELIFLEDQALVVERTTHRGQSTRSLVPLYGLRLESFVDPDYGLLRLTLLHRSTRLDIARDLSPDERSSFRRAFIAALAAAGHSLPLVTLHAPQLLVPESSR